MAKFLRFIEIRTKITSVFAFLIALAALMYRGTAIRPLETAVFFGSMLLIDLATTGINNYIDSAAHPEMLPYPRHVARRILYAMLAAAVLLGLYLAYRTSVVVLLIGMLCFACGVCYTYGPVAISRMPLGEVLSGIFYGWMIPFLLFEIEAPGSLVALAYSEGALTITAQVPELIDLTLLSIMPMLTTANIMLANNTCDLAQDIAVKRHTLVYYIGQPRAAWLFGRLNVVAHLGMLLTVMRGIAPVWSLLMIGISFYLTRKNAAVFAQRQVKSETFVCAIRNFVWTNALYLLSFVPALLMQSGRM